MARRAIALVTDFGFEDSFVGIVKGVILKIHPKARLIDLNHGIPPCNVRRAAFELLTAVPYFPEPTLFLTVVDPGVGSGRKIIFVQSEKHFFLAPDNGVLSWILEKEKPVKIVSVENDRYFLQPVSHTFHGRDIFAPVAAYWSQGKKIDKFGPPVRFIRRLPYPQIRFSIGRIYGEVLAIDRFGNLMTNLPNSLIAEKKGHKLKLQVKRLSIDGISSSYSSGKDGNWAAVAGSHGYIEVALAQGSAARELEVSEGEAVTFLF